MRKRNQHIYRMCKDDYSICTVVETRTFFIRKLTSFLLALDFFTAVKETVLQRKVDGWLDVVVVTTRVHASRLDLYTWRSYRATVKKKKKDGNVLRGDGRGTLFPSPSHVSSRPGPPFPAQCGRRASKVVEKLLPFLSEKGATKKWRCVYRAKSILGDSHLK